MRAELYQGRVNRDMDLAGEMRYGRADRRLRIKDEEGA